jgi:phosphatidate cytidylyltransferase
MVTTPASPSEWNVPLMQQRVFYGLLAIATLVFVALLDAYLASSAAGGPLGQVVARGTMIPLLFAGLVLGAGLEMIRLMRAAGLRPHAVIGLVMSLVLLLSPWLCAARLLGSSPSDVEGLQWQLIWLVVLLIATAVAQLRRGVTEGAIADIGATWMMALYLGLFPSFAIQLRCTGDIPGDTAALLVLVFLLVAKASDIGGYLVGSAVGRHKLAPAVSPSKSIEGAIGGIVASSIVALGVYQLYFFMSSRPVSDLWLPQKMADIARLFGSQGLWQVVIFGALMAVFGQLGDLLESGFKRAAHRKDSAEVLPGFGGMLDLIDSPVMAAPVAWCVLAVWWDVV